LHLEEASREVDRARDIALAPLILLTDIDERDVFTRFDAGLEIFESNLPNGGLGLLKKLRIRLRHWILLRGT